MTSNEASDFAKAYYRQVLMNDAEISNIEPIVVNGTTTCYAVNFSGEGWMLVAADKKIDPIIGYSEEGRFDVNDMPPMMNSFLGMFADDIELKEISEENVSGKWDTSSFRPVNKSASTSVEPLIKVNWNQSGKYRQYCPSNSTSGEAIVGCVAVGMAQAMTVYRYPSRPQGYHSYKSRNYGTLSIDYDKEDKYNWDLIISGAEDKKYCARLLYQCGVSVDMDYDSDGSGVTYMGVVPRALKEIFGYSNKVHNELMEKYTVEKWTSMLKEELSMGRPLIYSGYSTSGGHCFNVDGYNESGLFHFNWGWAGSGNGYFAITSHTYNTGQRCVFDFAKPTGQPLSISLDNKEVEVGRPIGTPVANVIIDCDQDNVTWKYKVQGAYNILEDTYADAPFEVINNVLVTKEVLQMNSSKRIECTITATNSRNFKTKTEKFTISLKASTPIVNIESDSQIIVNGGNGCLTISAGTGEYMVDVISVNGSLVAKAETSATSDTVVNGLSSGLYIVRLTNGENVVSQMVSVR